VRIITTQDIRIILGELSSNNHKPIIDRRKQVSCLFKKMVEKKVDRWWPGDGAEG